MLKAEFADFSTYPDAVVASAINIVDMLLDPSVWPNLVDFANARMMYAAHLITMQATQAANAQHGVGPLDLFVNNISFGERSVSYGTRANWGTIKGMAGSGEETLPLTLYGQMFLNLRNRNIIPIMVV